jgi:hypothetical protein
MVLFICPRFRLAAFRALQKAKLPTDLMRAVLALAVTVEHGDRADLWQRQYIMSMSAKRASLLYSLDFVPTPVLNACERTKAGGLRVKKLSERWLGFLDENRDTLTLARKVLALSVVSPDHELFGLRGRFRYISLDMHVREDANIRARQAQSRQMYIEYKIQYRVDFMNDFTSVADMAQYREQMEFTYDMLVPPAPPFTPDPSMYIF